MNERKFTNKPAMPGAFEVILVNVVSTSLLSSKQTLETEVIIHKLSRKKWEVGLGFLGGEA